jgi:hypothetical protein
MKEWKTKGGSTLTNYREGNAIKFMFKEGGELPQMLSGIYTSERESEKAAEMYLLDQAPKHSQGSAKQRIKDAKTVQSED